MRCSTRRWRRSCGARWAIEECFQDAENEAGLDHYQVRHYQAWYRHVTLAVAAAAHLTALSVTTGEKGGGNRDLIRLSVNEIRRLLAKVVHTVRHEAEHILHWSRWRRRHQYRAPPQPLPPPRPPPPITASTEWGL
ncbi:hypothetical protein AB9128_29615 [Streptomyces cinereoruber]